MFGLTTHGQEGSTARPEDTTVWVTQDIVQSCLDEASAQYPNETGGTFMGWWSNNVTAVITAMIGPGPNAFHSRRSFQPDQTWQLEQIDRHYASSDRLETYLGDWHSHPDAVDGSISWTDCRVLRRVIKTSSARCSNPLMSIMWGQPDSWQLTTWCAYIVPRKILRDRLVLNNVIIKNYGSQ